MNYPLFTSSSKWCPTSGSRCPEKRNRIRWIFVCETETLWTSQKLKLNSTSIWRTILNWKNLFPLIVVLSTIIRRTWKTSPFVARMVLWRIECNHDRQYLAQYVFTISEILDMTLDYHDLFTDDMDTPITVQKFLIRDTVCFNINRDKSDDISINLSGRGEAVSQFKQIFEKQSMVHVTHVHTTLGPYCTIPWTEFYMNPERRFPLGDGLEHILFVRELVLRHKSPMAVRRGLYWLQTIRIHWQEWSN